MTISIFLTQALKENKITLTEAQQSQCIAYLELLIQWNNTFNLTSIVDPKTMVYWHLIDSFVIAPYLEGNRLLDVGSGGGLPGIPLAIYHPKNAWTLLDKNSKKTRFLTQVKAELNLSNVDIVNQRCEDFHPVTLFDTVVTRAFGSLLLFKKETAHLLNKNGVYLAMKGKYPEDEITTLRPHADCIQVIPITIVGMPAERHLVLFKNR